jgi:uncharacterized protein YidB (DUF937 family)
MDAVPGNWRGVRSEITTRKIEMAFIDLLLQETTEKFGLRTKGVAVISALLCTMNNLESGGIEGFLNRFRQAGLTEHVNAWLQNDLDKPLTSPQLETALGRPSLQHIADKIGLPLVQTSAVFAHLIPLIVGHLAVQNSVFSAQPNEIRRALWSDHSTLPPAIALNNQPEASLLRASSFQ